jgi:hypothetical protein
MNSSQCDQINSNVLRFKSTDNVMPIIQPMVKFNSTTASVIECASRSNKIYKRRITRLEKNNPVFQ